MAFTHAFKCGVAEIAVATRFLVPCNAPQRAATQLGHITLKTTGLPVLNALQGRSDVNFSQAIPVAQRGVVYVPPSIKKPIILPSLQAPHNYTLPSLVRQVLIIGDFGGIIAPSSDTSITEKLDPKPNAIIKKHAAVLIQIRKKKMKKHKLRKLRKRMHFLWAKRRFRIEKKKEQVFRAELLSQIHEAEAFDAEKYVTGVLDKIRNRPRPETRDERREKFLELMRKYRSNVEWVRPKLD